MFFSTFYLCPFLLAGVPNIYWCGTQGNYNVMVIDLLGTPANKNDKILKLLPP